jgi:hypothetical protein
MPNTIIMMLLLAQTGFPGANTSSATLAVSATVIRPVSISKPSASLSSKGSTVTIRETENLEISVEGGTLRRADDDSMSVTVADGGLATITVTY